MGRPSWPGLRTARHEPGGHPGAQADELLPALRVVAALRAQATMLTRKESRR